MIYSKVSKWYTFENKIVNAIVIYQVIFIPVMSDNVLNFEEYIVHSRISLLPLYLIEYKISTFLVFSEGT